MTTSPTRHAAKVKRSSKRRKTEPCIERAREFLTGAGIGRPGARLLAAVSGGSDSMALMAILSELSGDMGFDLAVAHFDHGIRPEAERERAMVERSAKRLGLPCFLGAGDVPAEARKAKKGLEETGRLLRLRFLEETARSWTAEAVALGHTKDDAVETILHHVIRGSGWRGLRGIPARRGVFVRPLLGCARSELKTFLRSRGIRYANDRSNYDTRLLRNRIRRRLIPYLKRHFNPSIEETITRLGSNLGEGWETLEKPLLALIPPAERPHEVTMALSTLAPLSDFELYLLVDLVLRNRLGAAQDTEKKHFDAVKRLIRAGRSGRRVELPHGIEALVEHSRVVLRRKGERGIHQELLIPGTGTFPLPGWNLTAKVERVPAPAARTGRTGTDRCFGSIRFPLRVRERRPGDRIVPFGMRGRKKLSDLLIDRKVPRSMRDRIPIFEDARGIFWVPGVASDERTRIGRGARRVLRIILSPTGAYG